MTTRSIHSALLSASILAAAPALAADVTPERLANPDKEPQNWLMNHRTYDAQRYSPLARINKDNVKSLKLAYSVALGGTSATENLQATPLVDDGFMYIVDLWGIVYKIDVRSGDVGRIVWRMDAWQVGGAAMWITGSYDVATNQVIWGTGNPVPMFDPTYRPGDNLYTDSMISWNPDTGAMNWFFQYTPGDMWDYDAAGTHILIDGQINGQPRKLIT